MNETSKISICVYIAHASGLFGKVNKVQFYEMLSYNLLQLKSRRLHFD